MLTDEQVDRYSRHVILPEIGARRQEAWLRSVVALSGPLDTAIEACGIALGAAGVGFLDVDASAATRERLTRSLAERTPDVRVRASGGRTPMVRVLFDTPPQDPLPSVPTLWLAAGTERLVRILLPVTRACRTCLQNAIAERRPQPLAPPATQTVLGLLGATDVARVLLELPGTDAAQSWELDLRTFHLESRLVPVAPDCVSCSAD